MSVVDVIIEVATDLIGGRVSWRFYVGLAFGVVLAIMSYWLISAAPWSSVSAVSVFLVALVGAIMWESRSL
jgi:membrane protein YdbS with pleckstrin-like domain